MIINSDFHIHTECSYDASNPLKLVIERARAQGLSKIGVTDHLNFNDEKFVGDLMRSRESVLALPSEDASLVTLGVELTPIELPEFQYIASHRGIHEGYEAPVQDAPYEIELAMTREELKALGVRYAIGAAHWRLDVPNGRWAPPDLDLSIREWYRQQMYLACDERVTILGHPWYHGKGLWYDDFSVIPHSMNMDIASALKENGKAVECNSQFYCYASERFKFQYSEFLRELFEMGIPVTYGSDSHHDYKDYRPNIEKYLSSAGFVEGDFTTLSDTALW